MALEKVDGVAGAYINKDLILHLAKGGEFDQGKVQAALAPYKIKIKSATPMEGAPL